MPTRPIRFGALLRQAAWTTLTACAGWHEPEYHAYAQLDRKIAVLRAQGITSFVCLFTDGGQPETVRLFGERVLPAFR